MQALAASCEELRARTGNPPLDMAGIDTTIFTAHSTRTASTSCAKAKGLPSHVIMAAADWLSESMFAKFYDKCIVKENFGGKLLEQ